MPVTLKSTGGGSVTLAAPSTASDLTVTLPSTTGGTLLATPLTAGTTSLAPLTFTSGTNLTTATAGVMEYDGKVPYFTPQGTQRGIIPGMQFYRLDSSLAGANVNTAQSIIGVGVTLSSSTVYAFQAAYAISKTAGTTSHSIGLGFGGTATLNNIAYSNTGLFKSTGFTGVTAPDVLSYIQVATNTTVSAATTAASVQFITTLHGTVSVNAGGTFIPQYTLSAAPGGAYTTAAGCFFRIYPIGASGANINVGTWA
jgi:hypothetical protein